MAGQGPEQCLAAVLAVPLGLPASLGYLLAADLGSAEQVPAAPPLVLGPLEFQSDQLAEE